MTPKTGDKPAQPSQGGAVFSSLVRQKLSNDLTFSLSGGKRTRFASARELFGEALGRFLINPDLKPETALLIDAELAWVTGPFTIKLNPYFADGKNTISQRVVGALRQRFNLSGTKA